MDIMYWRLMSESVAGTLRENTLTNSYPENIDSGIHILERYIVFVSHLGKSFDSEILLVKGYILYVYHIENSSIAPTPILRTLTVRYI